MNIEDLEKEISDLDVIQVDNFTQTSKVSIDFRRPPLPKDNTKSENNPVNVLKYCHILQDLECPQNVNDGKSSFKDEIDNISLRQGTSKIENKTTYRDKYYQEVVKPLLKDRSNIVNFDEIILKALDSVSKGTVDSYLPLEVNTSKKGTLKADRSFQSINSKVGVKLTGMAEQNNDVCTPKCESNDASSCPPESCTESSRPGQIPTKENLCGTLPPKKEPCAKKAKCKPKIKKVCSKQNMDTYDQEADEVIVTTNDNDDSISNENVNKTFSEVHNETLAILKIAMEDFIGKVYKTTQEAVTLIASESAKQIAKAKISEAINTNIQKRDKDSVESTSGQRSDGKTNESFGPGAEVIESLLTKVDSAFTVLGEHISKSFENFSKTQSFTNNNKYDEVKAASDVAHVFTPEVIPTANSVFSAIKSKIVSIFCDPEPKAREDTLSRNSTMNMSADEEEEEDEETLSDKLIE